jgi:prepilin-type N-terminal cleavage/methylation domain-containing protein
MTMPWRRPRRSASTRGSKEALRLHEVHPGFRAGRAGFSLVELMVAILVMTVGVLGLAGTAALVLRLIGGGAQQTLAAHVAQSRFEQLRATECGSISDGYATVRGVREAWSVSRIDARTFDVADTLRFVTRHGERIQAYRSTVRCLP